jgi:hypothetical protein
MKAFAILVIDLDGDEEYLCNGLGDIPARFPSRAAAQRQVDFMKIGMEDEVQSINIVSYPPKGKLA